MQRQGRFTGRVFVALSLLVLLASCSDDDEDSTAIPVLTADSGSFFEAADGSIRLALGGVVETVKSDDLSQSVATDVFLDAYPFDGDSPSPVAIEHGPDRTRIEVALANPLYDPGNATLEFDVFVADVGTLPTSMDSVEIRLEDCPDQSYLCAWSDLTTCNNEIGPIGTCWKWLSLACLPCSCSDAIRLCTEKNPTCCPDHGGCVPAKFAPAPRGLERFCL